MLATTTQVMLELEYVRFRLQLKRGLFWYRYHQKNDEMVSVRSSRAENWTNVRKIRMRIFLIRKMWKNNNIV